MTPTIKTNHGKHEVALGTIYLGLFNSLPAAQGAITGALAVLKHNQEQKDLRRHHRIAQKAQEITQAQNAARRRLTSNPSDPLTGSAKPAQGPNSGLPRGIRATKTYPPRYQVVSPSYGGTHKTLEEALQAQKALGPFQRKPSTPSGDFETRNLKLA